MKREYPKIGRRGRAASTREIVIARTPFIVVYRVQKKPALVEIIRVSMARRSGRRLLPLSVDRRRAGAGCRTTKGSRLSHGALCL